MDTERMIFYALAVAASLFTMGGITEHRFIYLVTIRKNEVNSPDEKK